MEQAQGIVRDVKDFTVVDTLAAQYVNALKAGYKQPIEMFLHGVVDGYSNRDCSAEEAQARNDRRELTREVRSAAARIVFAVERAKIVAALHAVVPAELVSEGWQGEHWTVRVKNPSFACSGTQHSNYRSTRVGLTDGLIGVIRADFNLRSTVIRNGSTSYEYQFINTPRMASRLETHQERTTTKLATLLANIGEQLAVPESARIEQASRQQRVKAAQSRVWDAGRDMTRAACVQVGDEGVPLAVALVRLMLESNVSIPEHLRDAVAAVMNADDERSSAIAVLNRLANAG